MNGRYAMSRWCKTSERNGALALFHSLTMAVVFLPSSADRAQLAFSGGGISVEEGEALFGTETFQGLLSVGLVVPVGTDEMTLLGEIRDRLVSEVSLDAIYLLLTDACNLKCSYCSEEIMELHERFHARRMTDATIDHALGFFGRLTKKYGGRKPGRRICLYGGEPLLNKEGFLHALNRIGAMKDSGELPENTYVTMITNGQYFTDEIAAICASHNVTVSVSIDGPERFHDMHRKTKRKTGSFAKAKEAFHIAQQHGVNVGVSVTLTEELVESGEETIKFFAEDLGLKDWISFNILHFIPGFSVKPDYYEKVARFIIAAYERFSEAGITEDSMQKKFRAFKENAPMLSDCIVNGDGLVISPEGRVGPCIDLSKSRFAFGGSVHDLSYDPVEKGLFNEWRTRSPFFMPACYDCEAIGICGGGCPVSVECQTGSRWQIDPRICPHSKRALEWFIWQNANK